MKEEFLAVCKYHGETLFIKEKFNRNQRRCKKCRSQHVTENRRNNKKKLVSIFGGKCLICGYNKHFGSLEFHHLNPEQKSFSISRRGLCISFESALEEAKKCILLCSNCHKEVEDGITKIPESNNSSSPPC